MERRRREREEGKGRWAESLRNPANVVKDANWLKKKQKDVLKNILGAKGPIENCKLEFKLFWILCYLYFEFLCFK